MMEDINVEYFLVFLFSSLEIRLLAWFLYLSEISCRTIVCLFVKSAVCADYGRC